ncbi:class I SAM-dependent methyltransferase [Streptomyces arenae]|uniref:class I SAM-dependent methyltransferase n=1 Tax=Streptomyces arenae TaxID=29301 RepID=UPI00265A949E|nr:class I SAM-dependent methyltransferase [Streptomyces arenae]MCG7209703.1 class I SAM-dependent methyltransferase [Streptomyces arenae]
MDALEFRAANPRLRDIFDEDAERYERARPRYPAPLIEELVRVTGAAPGARVLEIAPGTGKLTVDLAGSGCAITAVEIGPSMAAVARRRLAAFTDVEVVVSAFEQWRPPPEPFDAVVCATALHWLDPAVRVPKAARVLRPGGLLGIIATHHVAGGTEEFFAEVQECYERWDPATPPGLRQTRESDLATDTGEFTRSPYLTDVTVRGHAQEITYTADQYVDVLLTYSNHRALPGPARSGLLADVRELIESRYDGAVTKRYWHALVTAVRTDR